MNPWRTRPMLEQKKPQEITDAQMRNVKYAFERAAVKRKMTTDKANSDCKRCDGSGVIDVALGNRYGLDECPCVKDTNDA